MNEKYIYALRKIALLGGLQDYIAISSRELGDKLKMSQQSASKRILELLDAGLIQRDLGARRQRIRLTDKGVDMLRREYLEYQKIFEMRDHVTLKGIIATGMGEGKYYMNQECYADQIKDNFDFRPYEGTLNIMINQIDMSKLEVIRAGEGARLIKGFTQDGRTFGDVSAYKAKIQNINCAVVVPERSHYENIIEIVCQYHLRRTLGLRDGDPVTVQVSLEGH